MICFVKQHTFGLFSTVGYHILTVDRFEQFSVQTFYSVVRHFLDFSCTFVIALSGLSAGLQLQLPVCPTLTSEPLALRHMTFVCV